MTDETSQPREDLPTAAGLDVTETDDYLFSLLLPRYTSMWKYLGGNGHPSSQLMPWAQSLIHVATLIATSGQTPATAALGLKAVESDTARIHPNPTTIAKCVLLSAILPAIYQQLSSWYESSSSLESAEEVTIAQIAHERRRKLARYILNTVEQTLPILRLCTLLSWWTGKGRAPTLAMTLAGASLVATRPPQRLHVTYAHRRWLYEEVMRTMQILAPFSSWNDLSSFYAGMLCPVKNAWERIIRRGGSGTASKCPICESDPIGIPYVTNCGHVYCYACLWTATSKNAAFTCRVCRHAVTSSQPYLPLSRDGLGSDRRKFVSSTHKKVRQF